MNLANINPRIWEDTADSRKPLLTMGAREDQERPVFRQESRGDRTPSSHAASVQEAAFPKRDSAVTLANVYPDPGNSRSPSETGGWRQRC